MPGMSAFVDVIFGGFMMHVNLDDLPVSGMVLAKVPAQSTLPVVNG